MQVKESSTEGLCHAYKIKVEAQDVEKRMNERLGRLGETAHLPGFRPGKVPPKLLRQRYGKSLLGEVLEEAVNTSSQAAIAERELRLAMQPKIEIDNFEEGQDLEYTLNVELMPEIEPGDYSKIEVERLIAEPSKKDVDAAMQRLADAQKTFADAPEDHTAVIGNVVMLDFVGRIDGEEFEGGKAEGIRLELGTGQFIPGFEGQLVGAKAGDRLDVTCTFPADYGVPHLAGREAVFETKVDAVQIANKNEIDEKLAERLGLETLDKVREAVTDQLKKDYAAVSRRRLKRALLDELALRHDFEVPPGMAEEEFKSIWREVEAARERGGPDPDDEGKSDDELKKQYRDIATRRVRLGLLLAEVGRRNNIEVSQEELDRAVQEHAMRYSGQEQEVLNHFRSHPQDAERLRGPIVEEKVVDFVLEIAKVSERKVSQEELNDESETPIGTAPGEAKSGRKSSKKAGAAKKLGEKDGKKAKM